ncbi:hypothetical protein AGRA3207_000166 [Actinomadura graeca]|uniref:Uncharacterized protein n=1 Tax=Actinomadura graeca TaxID=2750812 RepID=A0ABX8QLQ8_9ACTN|nr:hypothetical protein [Actinomadura graeca]QXJ19604.1 hypothetical protein AGRA3207_000166 [Actinomadura graeca]
MARDLKRWRTQRALAAALTPGTTPARPATATVKAANSTARTADITFHNGAMPVTCRHLAHYTPRPGDVVLLQWISAHTAVIIGAYA